MISSSQNETAVNQTIIGVKEIQDVINFMNSALMRCTNMRSLLSIQLELNWHSPVIKLGVLFTPLLHATSKFETVIKVFCASLRACRCQKICWKEG